MMQNRECGDRQQTGAIQKRYRIVAVVMRERNTSGVSCKTTLLEH